MTTAGVTPIGPKAASLEAIRLRARVLAAIRRFFEARGVLEVETPLLGRSTVTDPHIGSLRSGSFYLQTSPEFAMKRLLAAGSGPIYQICKAFRAGESGARHSPEFTMLEWYRPGFDHHALMDEVDELLGTLGAAPPAARIPFSTLFERHVGLDPLTADARSLRDAAARLALPPVVADGLRREDWLLLLMAQWVEPRLPLDRPTFVFDYPVELAALARIRTDGAPVAERFEVYFRGLELANGYHELTDAREQRARFERDLEQRRALGIEMVPLDERLLEALESGLPACSGVALGLDRLLMGLAGSSSIADVQAVAEDLRE